MDVAGFTELKAGGLRPITSGDRQEWAFVPAPLPVSLTMNDKLWALIAEANGRVNKLDGIASALPSPSLLLRPLQRREALTSNRLEGTFVTPKELLLFEAEMSQTRRTSNGRDEAWREVFNCDVALRRGCERIAAGSPLDRTLLCELHGILLAGVRGREKTPGQVRDIQVFIGASHRYTPPPPGDLGGCLDNLEAYLTSPDQLHPLVKAYVVHYQFEAIHPFTDGNGRAGRLWLSLTLYKWLQMSKPWLYMSEFFEKHRGEYIERLFRVSANGEWNNWLEFCLLGAIEQAGDSIKRCQNLGGLKSDYQRRFGHESPRMPEIIERLFDNPFVDAPGLGRQFGVSYPTAKSDIDRLVNVGVLTETEKSHPKTYLAREIFQAAYGD